jgi:hypothetical protein
VAHGGHTLGFVWLRVNGRNSLAKALVHDWREHEDSCSCMAVLRFKDPSLNDERGRRFLTHDALLKCLDHWEGEKSKGT